MPARGWKHHTSRLLGLLALAVLLGLLLDELAAVLLGFFAAYSGWMLFNAWRLAHWLQAPDLDPPESAGLWADLFDRIGELQRRNERQRTHLQSMIAEFQSVTDALPDATLVIDEHDVITWFNDAARQMLELRIPEDLGQAVTNLIRGPDFANWLAVSESVRGRFEMTSPFDDNVRFSVTAVRYRHGQRLLILRDVTDVHLLEQVRRDFVANVSHELRTPLTVLLGYLESIQDSDDAGEIAEAIGRMQGQARQMQALLNDLLELSRLQSAEREDDAEVDVPAILMLLKEQAEELSQGAHDIRFEITPGLKLKGAPTDLESAFRNLITNAVHYTPPGGKVRVRWREHEDGGARLVVADTGIGIPKRDIPRLTERFYRVGQDRSRNTGGTGLGLAIVKHVLNAHQASLRIESTLGEGSRFSCLFPAQRVVQP